MYNKRGISNRMILLNIRNNNNNNNSNNNNNGGTWIPENITLLTNRRPRNRP